MQHMAPTSFENQPLTPPPTDKQPFVQVQRVLALLKTIRAGRHIKQGPWTEFQLVPGEYDEIERQLSQDEALLGYVKDKIRYDYFAETHLLVVRLPTGIVHNLFIGGVEDAIRSQLKTICSGRDKAASFARKIQAARSTEIYFPVENAPSNVESKHEPDASFWHDDARYPGVIIEVAYSQKKKRLDRLAEDYLIDSDASVQVVVGLDIEYGNRASRKATLSIWRTRVVHTTSGDQLHVVKDIADEAFRTDQGDPTDHPGLRLQLSDFAYEELVQEVGGENRELVVSSEQLCQYLTEAESMVQRGSLNKHNIAPGVKKIRRWERQGL